MNADMKAAWLEITQMLGEPTKEELNVFLRTWQRAIEAERNATLDEIAKKIEAMPFGDTAASFAVWIREQKK